MKRLYSRHLRERSDEADIQAYREHNNMQALGVLFDRYVGLVYGVCLKYLADPVESEDATMEIFGVLLEKLKTHEITNFRAWLHVVVKNHCLQILRKRNTGLTEDLQPDIMYSEEASHPDYESTPDWKENGLHDCLEKLPESQKRSIELFYFKSRSYQEIADELDMEKEQVRSHIQNGRRNLKICMERKSQQHKTTG